MTYMLQTNALARVKSVTRVFRAASARTPQLVESAGCGCSILVRAFPPTATTTALMSSSCQRAGAAHNDPQRRGRDRIPAGLPLEAWASAEEAAKHGLTLSHHALIQLRPQMQRSHKHVARSAQADHALQCRDTSAAHNTACTAIRKSKLGGGARHGDARHHLLRLPPASCRPVPPCSAHTREKRHTPPLWRSSPHSPGLDQQQ